MTCSKACRSARTPTTSSSTPRSWRRRCSPVIASASFLLPDALLSRGLVDQLPTFGPLRFRCPARRACRVVAPDRPPHGAVPRSARAASAAWGRAVSRDLVIVGGGPAGLVLALAARQRGLTVTVVDKRRPPLDKPCGEGIMPAGVTMLAGLGVSFRSGEARAFRGIRYLDGDVVAEGDFPPGRHGLGVRRPTLHAVLVAAAERAGTELRRAWRRPGSSSAGECRRSPGRWRHGSWPERTGSARGSGPDSASPARRRDGAASAYAATTVCIPGSTESRCIGARAAKRTSPR